MGNFLNAEKHFYKVKNALSEGGYRIYTYFFCHNIAALFLIWMLILSLTTIGIIYNKTTHLVLRTRRIEYILINVNT